MLSVFHLSIEKINNQNNETVLCLSIFADRPRKTWENPDFPGLGNTPRNGSTGQYWVIRYFPTVFIMKYFKTASCIVA